MDALLQSQIRDSCRVAHPEGLKDLMWDISREVLRAQPKDLYRFITDYLSALMVVRENLRVAAHICDTMCDDTCHLRLEEEFKKLGLKTEEAETTAELVKDYLEKGPVVNECNLITKLMNETTLDEQYLPQIQSVVRNAFLQHHGNGTLASSEPSSNREMDEVMRATRHTLHLYKKSKLNPEDCVRAAITIQAAYRAYKVRRQVYLRDRVSTEHRLTSESEHFPDFYDSARARTPILKNDREQIELSTRSVCAWRKLMAGEESGVSAHIGQPYISTASSTSLAGAFSQLPKYKPNNMHLKEIVYDLEELPEKEHATIDYTQDHPQRVFPKQFKDNDLDETRRTIKFQETAFEVIEDVAEDAVDSHDESIEEVQETAFGVIEDIAKDGVDSHDDEFIEEVHEIHDMRGSGNVTD